MVPSGQNTMNHLMKKFISIVLSIGITGIVSTAFASNSDSDSTISTTTKTKDKQNTLTIVAVGDIMIGSNFPNDGFLPDDDAKTSFNAVAPFLKGDIVFGNLEGVLLDSGSSPKCPDVSTSGKTCYAFRMPIRYGQIIKNAGFNLLSVANNHVGDFGDTGRISTMRTLDKLGIHYAGLLSKPTTTFEQNGVKYGFVAFAPNLGTVPLNDMANAVRLVKELNDKTDIVIVSFHGGAEGAKHTRVTKETEMFMGENRGNVHAFAHAMIDAGADIILGHGPHVTRAVEVYKDRFIAYSLGNFNTYGAFNVKGVNGIAPLVSVQIKPDGSFVSADVVSIKQTKVERLQLDPSNAAFHELKQLTNQDFPDGKLGFSDNRIFLK